MGETIVSSNGLFEWDADKNSMNIQKHGISFEEAAEVFNDSNLLEYYDSNNSSIGEDRYIALGAVGELVVVVVSFTDRPPRLRIISARFAESVEKEVYYANLKRTSE